MPRAPSADATSLVRSRRIFLGPAGRVDAAERLRRPFAAAAPNSRASSGRTGFSRVVPRRALDTIIRCTSIVPEATVAACA